MNIVASKIRGLVYGMAFGDAWGFPTEFQTSKNSLQKYSQPPKILKITDDTQMSLYNIKALQEVFGTFDTDVLNEIGTDIELQKDVRKIFAKYHVMFAKDPRNDRAPGMTCMEALDKYSRIKNPVYGNEGAHNNSKGCGTIMRSPWLGVLPLNREAIAMLAIIQSQTTHGNPISWIAAAIASLLICSLYHEEVSLHGNNELFVFSINVLNELREMESVKQLNIDDSFRLVEDELKQSLNAWDRFSQSTQDTDMNTFFGDGWIAEETLSNAIAATSLYSPSYINNPCDGVKRLVLTRGDSDSIAAVGGAMLGVFNGYESFEYPIFESIEEYYKSELENAFNWLLENVDSI